MTIPFNGADAMVRMLQLNGVKHIFGLCGDTSLPFYDALARLDHGMEHILTRDERSAGYMADGYARVTGKVGVCEGPSGGGATYLLPGLVEANESSNPVLGITSDVSVGARGKFPLTELDQQALYKPLTKWNTTVDRVDQIPGAVRGAFRAMTTGRPGAAHICLPYDLQKQAIDEGVAGVIASVAGLITGAANDGGFKGLAGRFERRGLLRFGVAMAGEIRFTRLDNGSSVELAHFPQAVPRPTGLADLMRNALAPQADAATRDAFAEAWQGWVRTILIEHADDPALITENP